MCCKKKSVDETNPKQISEDFKIKLHLKPPPRNNADGLGMPTTRVLKMKSSDFATKKTLEESARMKR